MPFLEAVGRAFVPGLSSCTAAFLLCSGYCALSGHTAQHPAQEPSVPGLADSCPSWRQLGERLFQGCHPVRPPFCSAQDTAPYPGIRLNILRRSPLFRGSRPHALPGGSWESVCSRPVVLYGRLFALLRILRLIRAYGSTSCAGALCSGARGLMSFLETAGRAFVPGLSSCTAAFLLCSEYCALSGHTAQHPAQGPSEQSRNFQFIFRIAGVFRSFPFFKRASTKFFKTLQVPSVQ